MEALLLLILNGISHQRMVDARQQLSKQ